MGKINAMKENSPMVRPFPPQFPLFDTVFPTPK
uniref:Uncharacterized protein n=1 Tax=Anguilla anguilla TaxID=7936 RepID=A0A0E9SUD8_ANGAN